MSRRTQKENDAAKAANAEKLEALANYKSRLWLVPPSDRASAALSALDRIEADTDPRVHDANPTDKQKDSLAFQAVRTAAHIMKATAGWALDHQVGLASIGLDFVPIRIGSVRDLLSYRDARTSVDKHEHERVGAAIRNNHFDAATARRVLLQVVRALGDVLPMDVHAQVVEGLEALEFGETTPIFEAVPSTAKRQLRERRAELKAIANVEFQKACGARAAAAQQEVADAFGVTAETLRRWEKAIRKTLGDIVVEGAIFHARTAASQVLAARRKQNSGPSFLQQYGEEAVRYHGQRYKRLLSTNRQKASIPPK